LTDPYDLILLCNSDGEVITVTRQRIISHCKTIADLLEDVPDAKEFVIPGCSNDTLRWIMSAIDTFPCIGPATDIVNVVNALNYLNAEKLLPPAIKMLINSGKWKSPEIPASLALEMVYPAVGRNLLLKNRNENPLITAFIVRDSKKTFPGIIDASDETYVLAWAEFYEVAGFYFDAKKKLFLTKQDIVKCDDQIALFTYAVKKHGSFENILKLRLEMEQRIRQRIQYEKLLESKNDFINVKFSDALKSSNSEKRWEKDVVKAIEQHAERVSKYTAECNFNQVWKLVTLQKFKEIVNDL
jgi:hypothetical protein